MNRSPALIDTTYFTTLSDDAIPEMIAIVDDLDSQRADIVSDHLAERYQEMKSDSAWRKWQAYHVSRHRAFNLLQQNYMNTIVSETP